MPHFSNENKFIPVPAEFIRELLPQANATFVKVYLYLLMLADENSNAEFADIAETLGLLESDLMHAIKYWESLGVIFKNGDSFSFSAKGIPPVQSTDAAAQDTSAHPRVENLAEIIEGDKSLSDMFMLSQEILGKTITERDMETIYWFYSDLKMSVEVILLLLEYCVSKGKNRLSYIEKVAVSWNEMGLNTSESVALYIKNEEQKTGFLYSIRKIMGIADRSLSQIEEKYLTKWHEELGMSEEMIALAYEYCIIQTAKLSFPYMDKIITRWHKNNIFTLPAAEEDNRNFKNRAKREETAFSDNSYDHADLEKLTRNN
ncbi:MAG: DnaD domain protein [Clostridia bacterium]|nr:DnaD domain protein [Clostridia bacterium]